MRRPYYRARVSSQPNSPTPRHLDPMGSNLILCWYHFYIGFILNSHITHIYSVYGLYGNGTMIVLVGNQKGGCGKSTIAVNLCAELAARGQDVVLVDADRQGTAATWATDRAEHTDLPVVHCVQKFDNIRNTLLDLDGRYDHVVVDAAGRDSRELRTGMTAAHVLLAPMRPSQPDLDTLATLQGVIAQAKDLNPELTVCAVLTMAPSNPVVREVDEARAYLRDYPEVRLLATVIGDRKVYRDAISAGHGVVELDNRKAVDEVRRLAKEVFA